MNVRSALGLLAVSLHLKSISPEALASYAKQSLLHATARDAGHASDEAGEVHSVWASAQDHQTLGHEMTHVITHGALGDSQEALLGEGIAMCIDHSGRCTRLRTSPPLSKRRTAPALSLCECTRYIQEVTG